LSVGRTRLQSIDVYRGIALICMAAYHACWDLNFYGLIDVGIGVDPLWMTAQRAILSAFLLLTGAGLTLAHGTGIRWRAFWKREAILIGAALLVSLGTWFLLQDAFAYFGVLHAIALFSLLALPLVVAPLWIGILVTIVVLAAPALYTSDAFDPRWLDWIGFFRITPETADLVPVFPWFGVVLIGVLGMRVLRERPEFTWRSTALVVRALGGLGRWSLLFYLLHQLILVGIIMLIANIVDANEQAKLEGFTKSCNASCLAGPGRSEGAGAQQFCTNYCQCALDMTVRDNLWDAAPDQLKSMSGLCTAMSE